MRRLLGSVGTYTAASMLNKAIPFLLLPIVTRYLSPADYGLTSMFQVYLQIVAPFVGVNAYSALSVDYFRYDERERRALIRTAVNLAALSTGGCFLVLAVSEPLLVRTLGLPAEWLFVGILTAAAQFVVTLVLTLWQMEGRALWYGVFQIMLTATNVIVSLFLVIAVGMRWQGMLIGVATASAVFALVGLGVLARRGALGLRLDRKYTIEILKFGIPLIPHALGAWVIAATDRLLITNMVGMAATGEYVVGYQIGMVIGVLQDAFNRAWTPFLFERLTRGGASVKASLVRYTYIYFIVISVLVAGLSLVAPPAMSVFVGKAFGGATKFVFWIALGYGVNGMYKMVVNYVFYVKKTHILSWLTVGAAVLNVVLNLLLIRALGPVGAAVATAVSFAALFAAAWVLSARVYPMPWRLSTE